MPRRLNGESSLAVMAGSNPLGDPQSCCNTIGACTTSPEDDPFCLEPTSPAIGPALVNRSAAEETRMAASNLDTPQRDAIDYVERYGRAVANLDKFVQALLDGIPASAVKTKW